MIFIRIGSIPIALNLVFIKMLQTLFILFITNYYYKKVPSVIYWTAIPSINLNVQLLTILIILSVYIKYKYVLVLILFKFFKKISIFVFFKKINKFLLFNKIAIIHIFFYLLLLINIFILNKKKKINIYKIQLLFLITLLLGILWSGLEVLWGGFWNWNITELSIFIISAFILINFHKKLYCVYEINLTILIIFIYYYYNHILLITNIHSFTNNKYLKYSGFFIIPLIYKYSKYNNIFIYNIVLLLWVLQIIKFNITIVKMYKILLLTVFFTYLNSEKYSMFIPILIYYIHLYIFIIKNLYIYSKYINISIVHKLVIIVFSFIYLQQNNYNIFNFYNKKQIILSNNLNKNKFIYNNNDYLLKKYLIKRYKISIVYKNNFFFNTVY